ncbi:uncharacterized protein LOC129762839 [Toxorhynchites rutilus septentrionalis]|uniref:uncharacterized protein LOC129762839 n=1 Tax=Toxorhynchites rutilus septentrionalis TaxID=329112 RepID=UPI00247A5962|nr:uncharacterized protein LOC129762839 [Toxorhynchites rutilus septentrionalis]XP_055617377.1 uncharacterized protein LOC129762839 [Toxorhynchites rutilus septentrionalis]
MQNEFNMYMTILLLIVGFVQAEILLFSDCGIRTSRRQPRETDEHSNTSFFNKTAASSEEAPAEMGAESRVPSNRHPKIMHGVPTLEGQFPWQVSLELLHPSYGFIGHWCGGVLIDRNWVLSAAHCIHNDLFNLPLPALWTAVLGEYDRSHESGHEQRIPVDKIILHEKYHNFKHDLVLLKLTKPANIAPNSRIKKICLPFADIIVNSVAHDSRPELDRRKTKPTAGPLFFYDYLGRPPAYDPPPSRGGTKNKNNEPFPEPVPDRYDNYLRRMRLLGEGSVWHQTARIVVNQLLREHLLGKGNSSSSREAPHSSRDGRRLYQATSFNTNHDGDDEDNDDDDDDDNGDGDENRRETRHSAKRRRNDKFAHGSFRRNENYRNDFGLRNSNNNSGGGIRAIPDTSQYVDCLATGWGKSTIDDELTDILLQTKAPIQSSKKCQQAYGDFIKLHRGHLCAGNLDGTGGTCVGDSGGPLQCRITKHSPWILVGITSFGSGCAFRNYPDVYTKISFYRQWIMDTISNG